MEERTLTQAKAEKVQQMREAAEVAYSTLWRNVTVREGDIPYMSRDRVLFRSVLGGAGAVTQSDRDTLAAAIAIADRLDQKLDEVGSKTTVTEVDAVTW